LSKNIRKILAAVDGSKSSLDASQMAIDWGERYSADVTALYVVPPNMRYGYSGNGTMLGFPRPLKELLNIAIQNGQKYVDQVKKIASDKRMNVQAEVKVGEGSVSREIVEYAQRHEIDLIVVGTRGMSGIKKMLLGSTASAVVTYSHCPVLVVK
jgi:nucleotide-binding universal stress UspA family protein